METIGYSTLQIIPSMRDTGRNLTAGFAPFIAAGRQAGQDAGQAAATGVAAARGAVEKASATLAKARDQEADAAGKVRAAEAKLEELRNSSRASAAQIVAAEERLATARRNAVRSTDSATSAANQLTAAEERAANATDEVVRSGNGLASAFSGLGSGTKQMAAFAAAAGGASGAVALVGTAIEKEMGADKLAASLGASGPLAAEYGAAAAKAYAAGAGENLGEVQSAVGLVASSFSTLGFEGDLNIDEAASAALSFADIFDTDITSAVQSASTLVTSGLASGSEQAFDLMTQSFQRVPAAMRDELPEIVQEYGTNFRALGFDGEEAFNVLVAAAGQGKFALDKTGDALKEFTIRGSDMSKTSVAAYEAIGLNAEEMSNAIASGGDGAQAALQQTAAGLLTIEDPAARANAAIALFGTPLEDLSIDQIPAFLEGLSGAEPAMAGFEGALDSASSTMYDNLGSKLEVMKRGFQDTFVGLVGDNVLPILGDFSGALEENEGNAVAAIAGMTGLGGAVAGFETAKGTFDSVKEGVMGVKDGFMSVKDTATQAWNTASNAGSWVATQARATGSFVKTSASAVANAASTSAAWIGAQARAGAGWVAMQARAVGAFVVTSASAVAQAAVTTGAWVASQARAAAGWAVTAAAATGSFLVMSGSAIAQATATSAAWVASNARTATSFVVSRAAMVATTVATGAMTAAQWLLNAAMSANPIGLIIVGVTALVGALVWFFTQTELGRQIVTAAWAAIQNGWNVLWGVLSTGFDAFVGAIGAVGDAAGAAKDWVVGKFDDMVGFVTGLPGRIATAASGMWDSLGDGFKGVLNWIIGKWNNFSIGFKLPDILGGKRISIDTPDIPYFREGGPVSGPGSGTSDSILARLSNGEFVEPAASVTPQTLPLLEAIRSGWVPSPEFLHAMVGGVGTLAATGDYTGGLSTVGIQEDSALVDGILDFRSLLGFADGGLIDKSMDWARSMDPVGYGMGGFSTSSIDCSGMVSGVVNTALGRDPFESRMSTVTEGDWLTERGATLGRGGPGDLRVGWWDEGGGANGHTAGTYPDGTNFESNGSDGVVIGGSTGADDPSFTDHAFFPASMFAGGDLGADTSGGGATALAGSLGGSASSSGGVSSGGGGGATGIGGSFSGGNAGEVKIAGGDAQPVWVTNWPSNAGGSFSEPVDPMAGSGDVANYTTTAEVEPPETPLGGAGVDAQYQAPTAEDVGSVGTNFAKANTDQLLSDLGLPSTPGGLLGGLMEAIKTIGPVIEEHVHYHVDSAKDAVREHTGHQRERALAFNTGKR